jgi:hypothetical protein
VDFNCPNLNHLRLAAALANRLDGKLKLLTAVPAVDEGTLAEVCLSDAPVHPNAAMERIRDLAASLPSSPEVSIAVGRPAREIPRLAKQCGADLLFAGPGQTLSDGWGPVRLHPMVNQMPCPVICVDGASSNKAAWSFESVQAEERLVPVEQRVPVRAESREMVAATASR